MNLLLSTWKHIYRSFPPVLLILQSVNIVVLPISLFYICYLSMIIKSALFHFHSPEI